MREFPWRPIRTGSWTLLDIEAQHTMMCLTIDQLTIELRQAREDNARLHSLLDNVQKW